MKKIAVFLFVFSLTVLNAQKCLTSPLSIRGGYIIADGLDHNENKSDVINLGIEGKISLVAKPEDTIEYSKGYISGFKLFLINKTNNIYTFKLDEQSLLMIRQVYYNGKWQDLEIFPRSYCGNSYSSVDLRKDSYYLIKVPCYNSEIKAKTRFKLKLSKDKFIFSNEFDSSFKKEDLKQVNKVIKYTF